MQQEVMLDPKNVTIAIITIAIFFWGGGVEGGHPSMQPSHHPQKGKGRQDYLVYDFAFNSFDISLIVILFFGTSWPQTPDEET